MQVNIQRNSTYDVKEKVALLSAPIMIRGNQRTSMSAFSPINSPTLAKIERAGGRKGIVIGERKQNQNPTVQKCNTPTDNLDN